MSLKVSSVAPFLPDMISVLGSALAGIQRGEALAASSAASIARPPAPVAEDPDLASDFVTLSSAGAAVAIGAKVARADQETRRALLDIVA
jgi:hypothetical protein